MPKILMFCLCIVFVNDKGYPGAGSSSSLWRATSEGRLFDQVLRDHVKDGLVDYAAIANDDRFDRFLDWLADVDTSALGTKLDRMAFWINAYNALAIKAVLDNYPLQKVVDVPGFFDKQKHAVGGAKLTLDQVEKEVIFTQFQEPKLHFVLVCAATSCPDLPSEAYSGENVLEKMSSVTRSFLNNPLKNRLVEAENTFYLSQIFNWYMEDFTSDSTSVLDFVKPFLTEDKQRVLAEETVRIEYMEYDWSLNTLQK